MSKFIFGVLLLLLVGSANAQIEAILGIIGTAVSNGLDKSDRERKAKEYEDKQSQIEAERKRQADEIEVQRAERERLKEEHTAAVISGAVQPSNTNDLIDLYAPEDGWILAASPKIKADHDQYVISGKIVSQESDSLLLCQTIPGRGKYIGNYFAIRITKKTKKDKDILDRLRINGLVAVVGRYTRNINYQTVAAGMKVMPHLEADHLIIPHYVDSGDQ